MTNRIAKPAGLAFAAALAIGLTSTPAAASTLDPIGDFLSIYVGPRTGDLDVTRVSAKLTGKGQVRLTGYHADAIGTTVGSAYVWGIDRGRGTEILASLDPPVGAGIPFDAVAVLFADGTGIVSDLIAGGGPTALAASAIKIDGGKISVDLTRALLPSTGFAFADYQYNLWPRYAPLGVDASDNTQISDLAPDGSTTSAVPIPAALGLQLAGVVSVGWLARRRRSARITPA
jgi:hypothetical protein